MNSHVSRKAFTCFQHYKKNVYPEINMFDAISKQFRFMETHVVRNHVNFQN